MSITSKINQAPPATVAAFPKLMISGGSSSVYLMFDEQKGVRVHAASETDVHNRMGEFCTELSNSGFEDYHGSVTITQE